MPCRLYRNGHRGRLNGGFTRVDLLLTALAAVSTLCLLAVCLPNVREQHRRRVCLQNLRGIATALGSYVDSTGHYPAAAHWTSRGIVPKQIYNPDAPWPSAWPNITAIDPGSGPDMTHGNWVIELLEHLGRPDVRRKFDATLPISDSANRALRLSVLSQLRCPSDTYNIETNRYLRRLSDGTRSEYARGNYAINGGAQRDCQIPGQPADPCPNGFHFEYSPRSKSFRWWGEGVAGINKQFRPSQITARADTLIVVEELRSGIHRLDPRGVWSLGQIGGSITFGHGINGDAGSPNCPHDRSDDLAGCAALHAAVGSERLAKERMGCCIYCRGNLQATSRSMHVGGVNVLRASGSADFVSDHISADIWHLMHSRDTTALRTRQ